MRRARRAAARKGSRILATGEMEGVSRGGYCGCAWCIDGVERLIALVKGRAVFSKLASACRRL